MTVEVTQAHIERSSRARKARIEASGYKVTGVSGEDCPLALAILDALRARGVGYVTVTADTIRAAAGIGECADPPFYARPSQTVLAFLDRWDRRFRAEPIRLRIDWR